MKVVVAVEHRFDRTPDGSVWTQTMFAYSYWIRYFDTFDHVRVVARVRDVETVSSDWKRADGNRVSFAAVPYYVGPWQYLMRSQQIQRAAREAVHEADAVVFYVASRIATCIEPMLRNTGHPYGVYVIADPYDVFAPGSVRHPFRPFFRWLGPRQLRHQCLQATAAAYITKQALQQRYPPSQRAFSTYFSMAELPDAAFVSDPRFPNPEARSFTLITVGTLAQLYKAQDVLIDAIALCVQNGLNLKLVLVGDGKHRPELEAQARRLGLAERVCFRGQLTTGETVRHELDQADLFVLASHQEGLPRAMIEAMARALPCIGSTVGGIPELLPPEDLVPPGDATLLANKIAEVITDPERLSWMSARNLEHAREYRDEALQEQRNEFYRTVREQMETWLEQRS